MMTSGRLAASSGDRAELRGPVEALAGLQRGLAVLDAQLDAIAVELDLMHPARRRRRARERVAELRRDEVRHRGRWLANGWRFAGFVAALADLARSSAAWPLLLSQTASASAACRSLPA